MAVFFAPQLSMNQPLFGDQWSKHEKKENSGSGNTKKEKQQSSSNSASKMKQIFKRKNKRPRVRHQDEFRGIFRKHSDEYKLSLEIMTRDPVLNFQLWDESEIVPLESYRKQFCHKFGEFKKNQWFYENWVNCDRAIHYFYTEIDSKWKSTDDTVPLKEAIRTGKAIRVYESNKSIDPKRIMERCKEELKDSQLNLTKQLLEEGKRGTITVSEYLHVKKESNDERFKKLLDEAKNDSEKMNLVNERKDPSEPEYFDPKNIECQKQILVESHVAQFLADKRI